MGLFKKLFGGDDASCEDKGSCERAARDLEGGCEGKGSADGEPVFYADGEDEAIAGNLTRLELLLAKGADKNAKNIHGKTALDYARALGWDHVTEALSR